jgi:zinc protease
MRALAPLAAFAVSIGLLLGCSGGKPFGHTPAWELPPPPPKVAPIVQPGSLTRFRLDNGLETLILEDRRLPMVTLSISVRRGAGAVDPSLAGIAELTAELMNRGAGEMDALTLAKTVDDMGASLSISASWDSMSVTVSGLTRDADALAKILRDVALHPRLAATEAEKARAEQLAGLEAAKDNPAQLASWHAMAALYPDHRYGMPLDGTPETVAKLDAADARRLHDAYFVPGNAILSVSGSVDAAEWSERAKSLFGDWPTGEVDATTPESPSPTPVARRIVIVDKPDLVQARIILAHEGIARTDDRRIAAALLNDTLGGSGFSSRLMKKLRSDEGLTYGVGSHFVMRRRPGPFIVSTFTRVEEVRRAVDILLDELGAIRGDRPQSADELVKAKSFNVGQFGLGLETSAAVMGSLVDLAIYDLPEDSLDTYRARLQAVTAEEVAQITQDLLHPDRIGIYLLGPAESLGPQFADLGDVQIVEP